MNKVVTDILLEGARLQASDLHIEPWIPRLRYRIHGRFSDVPMQLNPEEIGLLVGRLKVIGRLRSWEHGLIQEGRIDPDSYGGSSALRISVFPTVNGEKIVIRYASSECSFQTLAHLGYPEVVNQMLSTALNLSGGLILIYGGSNSGKTTAAYTALHEIIRTRGAEVSLATLEDPVERNTRLFAQTDLSDSRGLSYEQALQALLRQDPEVLFIGEIRNAKTAAITFQAAMTGHLILTTVHAGSLSEAIARLLGFGLGYAEIFLVLRAALGLRLIPSFSDSEPHRVTGRKPEVELLTLSCEDTRKLLETYPYRFEDLKAYQQVAWQNQS